MQVLELNSKDYDGGSKINFVDGTIDAAFRKVRKNIVGFYIWKVENNRVETIPRDQYGIFTDDCTYIIYAANTKGCFVNQNTISREVKSNCLPLQSSIHFWLGAKTTAERSGNVAYKVIELDNHLENISCQYRETQEHESARFLSYFKDGITVYSHDDGDSNAQLFQVKDKKSPKCVQRTPINWTHFRSNYVMILKTANYIFVWIGRTSTPTERLNAFNFAARCKAASNKSLDIATVDDGYEQSMNDVKKKEWNQYLCLSQRSVHPSDTLTSVTDGVFRLYKCGFSSGKYRIEEIKSSQLEQQDLKDNDHAFIIDGGPSYGVWMWVGKYTDTKDKAEAMRNARGFVKKKNYPSSTAVIRVIEGNEPQEFVRLFPSWTEMDSNGNKMASLLGKFDAMTLVQRPHLAAESQLLDDGTGDLIIYRVSSNGDLVEIPKRKNVALFSGDCYLLHYIVPHVSDNNLKNNSGSSVKQIIYLWTGKHCPSEVRKQGESLAHEFSIHLRKSAVEVRVTENKESPHFLQLFKGHLVIFKGKCNDYDPSGSCCIYPNTYMLKVFGNASYNSKAIQISSKSSEFTSKDCFIIKAGDGSVWIWCGQCSTGDNREVAKSIGSLLGEYNLVIEANEPNELWQYIPEVVKKKLQSATVARNEHHDYGATIERNVFVPKSNVELYVCSIDTNEQISTRQLLASTQDDIVPEDVYLLDAKNFVYLWIGSLSSKHEKSKCWHIIKHYLKHYPIVRDMDTPRAVIYQGLEPATFTGYFEQWNPKLWDNHKTYEMERLSFESSFDGNQPIAAPRLLKYSDEDDSDFDRYPKYPVDLLRSEASLLPDSIDPKMKEMHLTHDDFVAIFNMDYFDFAELPNWKQQELKKVHKLF